MKHLASDLTESREWLAEQERRLLGFEVLRAFVLADGEFQMEPNQIAERTLSDKGECFRILSRMSRNPEILTKLKNAHD
jgi:hypothetical protein